MQEYQLLDATGKAIAIVNKRQIFGYLKQIVPDGQYRIVPLEKVGGYKIHCIKKDGVIVPDPDGVVLKGTRRWPSDREE